MRNPLALAALAATCLSPACTSTVMAEPRILVSPYLAVYQLSGTVGMQSEPAPGGPLEDNAPQTMDSFGQDHHREDVGVRVDIGDGFAGFRVDYYKLDMGTADFGVLTDDFGRLLAGDTVAMPVDMDEWRLGYLEPIVNTEVTWRNSPLSLQFAAGGVVSDRNMDMRARTTDGQRTQNVDIKGECFYPAVRLRMGWRGAALDLDYAISPDLVLGGDYNGTQHDLEIRGSYTLNTRDVTVFAGYRYSAFPAKGDQDGFAFDSDLKLDGFLFGLSVTF